MSYYIIKKYAAKLLDFGRLSLLFLKLKKIICFFKHNLGVDKAKIHPIFLNNMQNKAVYFITSDDDFIASNRAKKLFEEHSADVADEMSKEIIDASASKAEEAVKACNDTISAAATLSLFGGKKVVWMRNVNFINDIRAGKTNDAKNALEKLSEILAKLTPDIATVIINASPVSRAKKFYKDMQKIAYCEDFQSKNPVADCVKLIESEARNLKVKLEYGAAETLAEIVAGNPRMAMQELEKLATYVNFERPITEKDVVDMVPIFGENSFFEITEAFYSGDINRRLSSLRRYFYANKNASARPIISGLQRQNSLLIQLRALMDDKVLTKTSSPQPRGAIEEASRKFSHFFDGADAKSQYNIFEKNSWFLGAKLSPIAARISMKKLLDYQMAFTNAFEELIKRPSSDESIMRDLFSQP